MFTPAISSEIAKSACVTSRAQPPRCWRLGAMLNEDQKNGCVCDRRAASDDIADQRARSVSSTSRSVLVPAWQRIATAARWPHHRSPPVST
jgi:hypothetical protein